MVGLEGIQDELDVVAYFVGLEWALPFQPRREGR